MKTTLDLPDDLLMEAKAVAARRRTTLKELVTRSLRREISGYQQLESLPSDSPFEIGELGLPVLKSRGTPITSADVRRRLDEADEEDYQAAQKIARGQ